MATAPGVDNASSESAMTQASDPPPTEGQTHAMEVDDEGIHSLTIVLDKEGCVEPTTSEDSE